MSKKFVLVAGRAVFSRAWWAASLFAALLVTAVPLPMAAQTEQPAGEEAKSASVFELPSIFVTSATLDTNGQSGALSGTAEFKNDMSEAIGGLTYTIELLAPKPALEPNTIVTDNPVVYDRLAVSDSVFLAPQSTKSVFFSYTPPLVPRGEYRLRIQARTAQGIRLGWHDTQVSLPGSQGGYAILTGNTITAAGSSGPVAPLTGPNVDGGDTVTLAYTASNVTGTALEVRPTLDVYNFNVTQDKVETIQGDHLTIAPGQTVGGTFEVTAADLPEAYAGLLSLRNTGGARVSSLAEYRWVVRGVSAEIITLRLAEPAYRAGERALVIAEVVGPADRETTTSGQLEITLLNGGQTVGQDVGPVQLSAEAVSVKVPIELTADASELTLRARVLSEAGDELARHEYTALSDQSDAVGQDARSETKSSQWQAALWLGLIVVLLIVVIAAITIVRRRKRGSGEENTPPSSPTMTVLWLALTAASLGLMNQLAQASQGIVVRTATPVGAVAVFVNQPTHDNDPQTEPIVPSFIPFAATSTFIACDNVISAAELEVHLKEQGGKFMPTNNSIMPMVSRTDLAGAQAIYNAIRNDGAPWTFLTGGNFAIPEGFAADIAPVLECSDGADNDADGLVDSADPGCSRPEDDDELNPPASPAQCSDGIDNDGDGKIDRFDPGCHTDRDATKAATYDSTDNNELAEIEVQCAALGIIDCQYIGNTHLVGRAERDFIGSFNLSQYFEPGDNTTLRFWQASDWGAYGLAYSATYLWLNFSSPTGVNQPPVAVISAPSTVHVGQQVTASAAGSHDPDGGIASYNWTVTAPNIADDLDCNGQTVATGNSIFMTVTLECLGDYRFSLTVADDFIPPATNTTSLTVSAINSNPTAQLTISPNPPHYVDTSVKATGTGSDPDGDEITLEWAMTRDGQLFTDFEIVEVTATKQVLTFTPQEEGVYEIEFTVTDEFGGQSVETTVVTVGQREIVPGPIIER